MSDITPFLAFIKTLWPSHRVTEEMLRCVCRWDEWLSQLRMEYVQQAIRGHRRDFPDGTKPEWMDIFRRIAGKTREGGGGANGFEVLLRNVRKSAANLGHKAVGTWSDEDAWHEYCRANPHGAKAEAFYWRGHLKEIGAPVPQFLSEALDAEAGGGC